MLQLENSKKSLYKEIQQAYYNAVAAHEKFRSSLDADASAKESYELVLAKYENGKANITEFNEARDSFLESESNLARARYEFLFSAKLLDFYRGQKLIFKLSCVNHAHLRTGLEHTRHLCVNQIYPRTTYP